MPTGFPESFLFDGSGFGGGNISSTSLVIWRSLLRRTFQPDRLHLSLPISIFTVISNPNFSPSSFVRWLSRMNASAYASGSHCGTLHSFASSMRSIGDILDLFAVSSSIALVRTSSQASFEEMTSSLRHSSIGIPLRRTLREKVSRTERSRAVKWHEPAIEKVEESHKLLHRDKTIDRDRCVV